MNFIFPWSPCNLFSFAICQHPKDIKGSLQPYSQATLLLGQKTTGIFQTTLSSPVSVASEALTRLPHSLFPCAAKMMLTTVHTQKELGPSNITRLSLPSVRRTRPSHDLPPSSTAVFTLRRCVFNVPAHFVTFKFTPRPVRFPKIMYKCLLSIQMCTVFLLAFADLLTAPRYPIPSQPKVQTAEEGIKGKSNCYSPYH